VVAKLLYRGSLTGFAVTEQNERAFQKQSQICLASKKFRSGEKKTRYTKNIGLGIKTPDVASTGSYIDRKCLDLRAADARHRRLDEDVPHGHRSP
jgi:hypothetical protein